MATGFSYRVLSVPGEVLVANPGAAANPSLVFGDPNDLDGMNDGFYATSTPTIGISINGSSILTWSATAMALGALTVATTGTVATGALTVTGAASATGAITSSSPTGGIGYATGAGGTVTQATNKTTGVTLSKVTGNVVMNGAALASQATASFTVTNTTVDLDDVVVVNHTSAGTAGAYGIHANTVTAGAFNISVKNISDTSLSEAIVISFVVIKGVAA